MHHIILGILMMRRMTAYELRTVIGNHFQSMCSDSLGSIQAALKKLLQSGYVTYDEVTENSRFKKRYTITKEGRQSLIQWIKVPIDMSKTKNMDLGKFLFMGLVSKDEQTYLIDKLIASLQDDYLALKGIKESLMPELQKAEAVDYFKEDIVYLDGICEIKDTSDIAQVVDDYSQFSLATLEYGIDLAAFNLAWFKNFKEKIQKERKDSDDSFFEG